MSDETQIDELRRWEALADREAAGDDLSESERAFLGGFEHQSAHDEREAWTGVLGAMREHDAADARDEVFAARVLRAHRETHSGRRRWQFLATGVVTGAAAVAAAVLVWNASIGQDSEPQTRQAQAQDQAQDQDQDHTETQGRRQAQDETPGTDPSKEQAVPRQPSMLAQATVRYAGPGFTAEIGAHPIAEEQREPVSLAGAGCVTFESPWASLCLDDSARVEVTAGRERREIRVEQGRVMVTLDRLEDGRQLAVVAGDTQFRAVGTAYIVDASAEPSAAVLHGIVAVESPEGIEATLTAGQSYGPGDQTQALAWGQSMETLARTWRGGALGTLTAKEPHRILTYGVSLGPGAVALPEGSHVVEFDRRSRIEAQIEPDTETGVRRPAARKHAPKVVAESAESLANKARDARRRGAYKDAAALYEALIEDHPESAEAKTSRVALGDLRRSKLFDPAGAVRSYRGYLGAGGGPLAPEARFGIVSAERARGRDAQEKAAIRSFLEHHPDDWRSDELRDRLAEL